VRILVTRTDRMGDVILSIPAVRHLRRVCPDAYIAFMVASGNRELVMEEEDINKVIVYDKRSKHKGFLANLKFVRELRKKKFDLAIALHPSTRGHLLLFSAGIPRRIGYDKKWGHLLTKKAPHEKQHGKKHEVDYNLELVRFAGFDISGADRLPRVLVNEERLNEIRMRLNELGVTGSVVAVHAGASCRSKMWPLERFAAAADVLAEKYSAEIVIVGTGESIKGALEMKKMMKKKPIDMTGEIGLSELAALFSMCSLVISNDSGPAHLAAAVGAPVVVIFGRNDPGLSPARWAPITDKKRILHSPPECSPCLAHNCEIDFRCLSNITVQNVIDAANDLLAS
jgi:heptosyltransferase II